MFLSADEEREIAAATEKVPERRAACIDALRIVQRRRGYVSDDVLRAVADRLGLSEADLEGVATFYNLLFRRPVGRHVILMCDSVSCFIVAGTSLADALTQRLGIEFGETTPDGRFTLLTVPCLGACDHAPALLIDEELHGDVTPETLDALLGRYE